MATNEEVLVMKEASGAAGSADLQAMMEELKRLRMENEKLKSRQKPVSFSINEKGAVCVHGVGKFPFTMYKSQWERILEHGDQLKSFMKDHELELN